MAVSDPASGPDESLPWSLLPEPPGLTALKSAMGDLDEAMHPSTTMVESVRLLESASLGICDVADRIEAFLPEAEATLTLSLRGRGQDPAAAAAGAAADRMLLELAASLCTARDPLCAQCPLHPQCEWARDPECAEALT